MMITPQLHDMLLSLPLPAALAVVVLMVMVMAMDDDDVEFVGDDVPHSS